MNTFSCEGRIVQDAQLRQTNKGDPLSSFRLASNVGFGDNQTTLWIDCTIWGKRAQTLNPMLPKGQQVFICGELSERVYPKNDGKEGRTTSFKKGPHGGGLFRRLGILAHPPSDSPHYP